MTAGAWLYIEPYCDMKLSKGTILIYNTLNHKTIEITNAKIYKLAQRISKSKMPVINLSKEMEMDEEIAKFIATLRKYYMGDALPTDNSRLKPVIYSPIVKIKNDARKLRTAGRVSYDKNILEYLNELTIYINKECELKCPDCDNIFKLFPCCTKTGSMREMELIKIENIMQQIKGHELPQINITGGNIMKYKELDELILLMDRTTTARINYYIHYLNVDKNLRKIKESNSSNRIKIIITTPVQNDKLASKMEELIPYNKEFIFIIQKPADIRLADECIKKYGIDKYLLKPTCKGKYADSLRSSMLLSKKEILKIKISQRELFMREKTNPLQFGKLTINDDKIYSNLCSSPLGQIGKDSLIDCIAKELSVNENWLKTRNDVKPCCKCNYRMLCPPISNYEEVMKSHKICKNIDV